MHGLTKQKCSQGQAGVELIMSSTLYDAYVQSGKLASICQTNPDNIKYERLIGVHIDLKIRGNQKGTFSKKRKKNNKTTMKEILHISTLTIHPRGAT